MCLKILWLCEILQTADTIMCMSGQVCKLLEWSSSYNLPSYSYFCNDFHSIKSIVTATPLHTLTQVRYHFEHTHTHIATLHYSIEKGYVNKLLLKRMSKKYLCNPFHFLVLVLGSQNHHVRHTKWILIAALWEFDVVGIIFVKTDTILRLSSWNSDPFKIFSLPGMRALHTKLIPKSIEMEEKFGRSGKWGRREYKANWKCAEKIVCIPSVYGIYTNAEDEE